MNLPKEILEKIEEISSKLNKKDLSEDFNKISKRYMSEKDGKVLLNKDNEAIAYSIARMPATFSAVSNAYSHVIEIMGKDFKTMTDIGTGTGSATMAISSFQDFDKITCIEREESMIKIAKTLFEASNNELLKNVNWIKQDIKDLKDDLKSDLVVASYVLNEVSAENLNKFLDLLWSITNKALLIVDPGTPEDYKRMMKIKKYLIEKGAYIVAPCTSPEECELKNDWCNFTCRVERTKLHKDIKNGGAPYEDEKFTYLVFTRNKYGLPNARIIRHPTIKPNLITLRLCENGEVVDRTYTKKDKDIYKKIKKLKAGDIIQITKINDK